MLLPWAICAHQSQRIYIPTLNPPSFSIHSSIPYNTNHIARLVKQKHAIPAGLVNEMLVASSTAVQPLLELHLLPHKHVLRHLIQTNISPTHHAATSKYLQTRHASVTERWEVGGELNARGPGKILEVKTNQAWRCSVRNNAAVMPGLLLFAHLLYLSSRPAILLPLSVHSPPLSSPTVPSERRLKLYCCFWCLRFHFIERSAFPTQLSTDGVATCIQTCRHCWTSVNVCGRTIRPNFFTVPVSSSI